MGRLAMITVAFLYLTGFTRPVFRNARLTGSWDNWTEVPMDDVVADDGCPAFVRSVEFEDSLAGQVIRWGVRLDGPPGANVWGITTEVQVPDSQERYREFRLRGPGGVHEERHYLTWSRRLKAQKFYAAGTAEPDLTFAVWAPNARAVEVVFGKRNSVLHRRRRIRDRPCHANDHPPRSIRRRGRPMQSPQTGCASNSTTSSTVPFTGSGGIASVGT